MSIKNPEKRPSVETRAFLQAAIQASILLAAVAAVFFLLTNGIPFVQYGWVSGDVNKGIAVKLTRISAGVLAALLILTRLFNPRYFENLLPVRSFRFAEKHWSGTVFFLYLAYSASLLTVNLTRHEVFGTRAFDLGIFTQAIWTTLHGHFLYSSLKGGICLLGDHVSPLLALLAPIYGLWQDPANLLVLQVLVSAANLFLIAKIADEKLNHKWAVMAILIAYFVYLPSRQALHDDFHPEKLVEPLIFAAFWFAGKKQTGKFLLCLPVIAAAKENMLGVTFALGLYAALFRQMRLAGILVMVASLLVFRWELHWLVPHLTGKPYFYRDVYAHLSSPVAVLKYLCSRQSAGYLAKIFGPFLFLPFLHLPTFLLTLPILMQNLLASNPLARSVGYHYTTGLAPFLFISTICSIAALCRKFPVLEKGKGWIATAVLIMSVLQSGTSEYYAWWQLEKINRKNGKHYDELEKEIARIPSSVSVLAHNNLIPRLANRKEIWMFEYGGGPSKMQQATQFKPDYILLEKSLWEEGTISLEDCLTGLKALGYEEEKSFGGFHKLRRSGLSPSIPNS